MKIFLFMLVVMTWTASGCETAKKILGTSTATLNEARSEAIAKTYMCSFDGCYEAILALQHKKKTSYAMDTTNQMLQAEVVRDDETQAEEAPLEEQDSGLFDIFMQDRIRGIIVVMGIKGNVDTTEVGIFLSREGSSEIQIEVSSLSSTAKQRVADGVFAALDEQFKSP